MGREMMLGFDPNAHLLGGFSKYDGTVEFYGRIRSILDKNSVVLDYGAGRGAWYVDGPALYSRAVRALKPDVKFMIACDVDAAVLSNTSVHEAFLIEDGKVPLASSSIDILIADYVLEHIDDPPLFFSEVTRLLKPGGVFCARTPHALNYISIAARVIRNSRHAKILRLVQPNRKEMDVFPTNYKLNTHAAIRKFWRFPEWEDFTYVYSSEPQYFFGSKFVYRAMQFVHLILPSIITGNLFIFIRKRKSRD